MATISLVAQHSVSVKNQNHYHNILVSDINSKIANTIPANAKITKVVLRVNTKVSSGLPMCELYCYLGNNAGTSSNNTNLGKRSGDLPTSAKDYDWDLTSYFNSAGHNTYPFTMNTSSTYLIPFWLNDYIFSFKITCKVDLIVDYVTPYTITLNANGGTCPVSSITRYSGETYGTVTSEEDKPTKAGYKFSYWATNADGTGRIYASTVVTGNTTLYAIYEKLPPPKFTSVEIKYLDKQVSSSNKVIVNESFIISVSIT